MKRVLCPAWEVVPNPFNPSTAIELTVPRKSHVTLKVYDVRGRLVRVLVDARIEAGRHRVLWAGLDSDGFAVASGVYFCRFSADDHEDTAKMVLLK
jgi:flagellar hook assembly protein FlgD